MTPAALALILALAQAAPTPPPVSPPPYQADLLRLSEMMGALAYLADLCHAGDGEGFRDRISRLNDADPRPQAQKDEIAGAFNRGFEGYRLTYRACTDNARATIADYLARTQQLARDVAARFGG